MSWRAQNRSKDAKTPSVAGVRSDKPELGCCPIQPYTYCAVCVKHSPLRDDSVLGLSTLSYRIRLGYAALTW
jgi:hypothetical protein